MRDSDHPRILIVEDEPITRKRLCAILTRHGYQVQTAATAAEARRQLDEYQPHVVLLDILLPDSSDFSLAERIAQRNDCGLIITSAFDRREDRITGLRAGADDYLTKPCDMDELLLKVERLASRVRQIQPPVLPTQERYEFGPCTFEPAAAVITRRDGSSIRLTHKERLLLSLFVEHPGRLFSRTQLIDALQPTDENIYDRAIDSRISRLRRKIEPDPKAPELLKSIYGEGYLFDAPVRRVAADNDGPPLLASSPSPP